MEILEERRVLAAISWDGEAGNLNWHDPLNWDLDRVPGNGDDVTISDVSGNGETLVLHNARDTQINDLNVEVGVKLHLVSKIFYVEGTGTIDGTLQLANDLDATSRPTATMRGAGQWMINGDFVWNATGFVSGDVAVSETGTAQITTIPGTTTITPHVHLNNFASFDNYGTTTLSGPNRLTQSFASTINNYGEFVIEGGSTISTGFQAGNGFFYNHEDAVFRKVGAGTASIFQNAESDDFDNHGTVIIEDGLLNVRRNTENTGHFEIAPTGTLLLGDQTHNFSPESSIVGSSSGDDRARVYTYGSISSQGAHFRGVINLQGTYDVPWTVVDAFSEIHVKPDADAFFYDVDVLNTVTNRIYTPRVLFEQNAEIAGEFSLALGDVRTLNDAVLTLSGNSLFMPPDGIQSQLHLDMFNIGHLTWDAVGTGSISGSGDWFNEGTIEIANLTLLAGGPDLTNRGKIDKLPDTAHTQLQLRRGFTNEGLVEIGENSSISLNNTDNQRPRQLDGELHAIGTIGLSNGPFELYGGEINGTNASFKGLHHFGGTLSPNRDGYSSMYLGWDLFSYDDSVIHLDIGGTESGVNADHINLFTSLDLDGTLEIDLADGYTPAANDSVEIASIFDENSTNEVTGAFDTVVGRLISPTLAWEVTTTTSSVILTAVEISEAELAEILREEFNAGVREVRRSLPAWLDRGERTIPGFSQGLGSLFASSVDSIDENLLPTIDSAVTSIEDLRTQAISSGYVVNCVHGDAGCGVLFDVQLGSATESVSASLSPDAGFGGLSGLPDDISLIGSPSFDATVSLSNFGLALGSGGLQLAPGAMAFIEVTGGGSLSQSGYDLPGGSLDLDYDAVLSMESGNPITATLSFDEVLAADEYADPPDGAIGVDASGRGVLDITHTIGQTGLSFDGSWIAEQTRDGESFTLGEVSGDVSYPSSDDWLASGLRTLGAAVEVILGAQAASNFSDLSLPLIADADPSDAAPGLVGINTADYAGPNRSWMDKIFSGITAVFSIFDEGDPRTGGEGQFGTEGDTLTKAHLLRHHRDLDGAGVRVGVISTGADGREYATLSGDIPANIPTRIDESDKPFGGRGTAMLEVIHDLAPGAELAFAAATDNDSLFSAIRWLIDVQEVDVIVSDLNDYSESFFDRDALTRLIEDEINEHDIVYVQAAGNDGQRAHQDQLLFDTRTLPGESTPRTLHRFGGTPSVPSSILPVTLEANSSVRFVLQTDQSTRDPDAQVVLGTFDLPVDIEINRVGFSVENPASRDRDIPLTVDSFVLTNRSSDPVIVNLTVDLIEGAIPSRQNTEFRIVALGDAQIQTVRGPNLFGAAFVENALVVGAMDAADTSKAADYSSYGDLFGRNVDVVGPAGIETSGFGMRFYEDFFGTSSGAAHIAAIAALLKAVKPDATSDEIRGAIKQTAKPLGLGVDDPQSGFGLVDAAAAAQQLDPIDLPPGEPTPREVSEGVDWLGELTQFIEVITPSEAELEALFSATQPVATELLRLRLRLDGESVGSFAAEFPFLFDGIAGFDDFDLSGSVGVEAVPDVLLQFGWDDAGWYLETDSARLGLDLKGNGQAKGVAFDQFGVGVEGTITAKPYFEIDAIDRGGDGRIRQDDIDALQSDLLDGDVTLVLPKLDEVDAEVTGDLILGFLDYVDVDPKLPNRPNGGDPFIVRGKANLTADLTGSAPIFAFEELRLSNPDIDGDGRLDHTLGALARNAVLYGEELLNSLDIPGFANDLLGELGLGDARRDEALERPRGMLPDEPLDTGEAIAARQAINARVATALSSVGNDGGAVDHETLRSQILIELESWLSSGEGSPAEGESASTNRSILERLRLIELDILSPQIDDPSTGIDEFEVTLNEALGSYERWIAAIESAGLTPEEVTTPEKLERLQTRLVNALRYAIRRAHVGAIQLHLDGAPLNHQYDAQGNITQRGVLDRAVEAVFWAQSAEFLGLDKEHPELSVARAYEDLVVRANLNRAELSIPEDRELQDNYIGPDESVQLAVEVSWQIKLPPQGDTPDITGLFPSSGESNYDFGPEMTDAGGNFEILSIGDGNNNHIGGEVINREDAFFIPLPLTGALSPVTIPLAGDLAPIPITRGVADSGGRYQASVSLGEGDTEAKVSVQISLNQIPVADASTNRILGRPSLQLFGAESHRDDSSLRQSNFFVTPGSDFVVQAHLRRGNGPLGGASVHFSTSGEGSFNDRSNEFFQTIRTSEDGIASVDYFPSGAAEGRRQVIATFYENGQLVKELIEFRATGHPEFSSALVNPIAGFTPTDASETLALRDALNLLAEVDVDQLSETQRSELVMLVDQRAATLITQADQAFNDALLVPIEIGETTEGIKQAVVDYLEWTALATAAGRSDAAEIVSIGETLAGAIAPLANYWLMQFDGTPETGGLRPFYQAYEWGRISDFLLDVLRAHPASDLSDLFSSQRVIELSGIAIDSVSAPQLTREGDVGRFQVGAHVVKNFPDGSSRVVAYGNDGLVAPVEVKVVPAGLAEFELDLSASRRPAETLRDSSPEQYRRLSRETWLGSHLKTLLDGTQGLEASEITATGTATPAPGEDELRLNVALGIPGIILETHTLQLQRPAKLSLQAKIKNDLDSEFGSGLTITSMQRAVLRAELAVESTPVDGDVTFQLIGRGRFNQTTVRTGESGVSTEVEFIPPIRPSNSTDEGGTSLIIARSIINGVLTTDVVSVDYEFRSGTSDDDDELATPDYLRANAELEAALRNNLVPNPDSELSEFDGASFALAAVEILRDWFTDDTSDTSGEGSVTYWLSQVQSYDTYPQDLQWHALGQDRDSDFRNAFRAAIENWIRWHAMVETLNLDPNAIAGEQLTTVGDLIEGAFRHAIQRVHDRCAARATEYIDAPSNTPEDLETKELLLERLIVEGGLAISHYSAFELLTVFAEVDAPADFQFTDILGQLCYQVEFVEEESFLAGRPESARVHVQAGIRVTGVDELIIPTRRMPLIVVIDPVDNATLDGVGVGRTDENGVYDRVRVSAG
ncbi:MAG: S8 family serine peptidase, partial [Planctomycetota bacterium]